MYNMLNLYDFMYRVLRVTLPMDCFILTCSSG